MLTKAHPEAKRVSIKMKSTDQYSHVVLFVPRYFYKMEFGISSNFAWSLIPERVKAVLTPVGRNNYCRKRELCTLLML